MPESTAPQAAAARLRAAREARGLTQQKVADELGVSRPLVIAIEKGTREPTPHELIALSRLYGCPVNELLRPEPPTEAVGVQFRAVLTDHQDTQARDDAITPLEALADDYLELARLAGTSLPRRYPDPVDIEGLDPTRIAEDLAVTERNRLGLGDGPLTRLRDILDDEVGMRVFTLKLPSAVAGLFAYAEPIGALIAVNASHPTERQRWSLAHEYAHFLTSRRRAEITVLGRWERVPAQERLADAFAANFLMPRNGLVRRFHELRRERRGAVTPANLLQLARTYRVSLQALMYRCEDLRLLSAGSHERLTEQGFRADEARALLGIPRDHPDFQPLPLRYQFLALELFEQAELSEAQFARFLRLDRVSARSLSQELAASSDVSDTDGSPVEIRWADAI